MPLDRRQFVELGLGAALGARVPELPVKANLSLAEHPLRSPGYDQVTLHGGFPAAQAANAVTILGSLDADALLKPFRTMGGLPAPGRDIGGWYGYLPDYNWHTGDAGLAPGHAFGQWTSALARFSRAETGNIGQAQAETLQHLLHAAITPEFFDKTRYPAYTLDKLNCGLLDAHTLLGMPDAFEILEKVHTCAAPSLPGSAYERDQHWRPGRDFSYTWDESYTLPENLYLLYAQGAGERYRTMARAYLMDSFFDPLARGEDILGGLHGYSHSNALCSAMQAWFVDGSQHHLQAARNGYAFLLAQSYATGAFAPDEMFVKLGSDTLYTALTESHNTFETPCCTYAFLKLSRYLLEVTRDGVYGDAMERMLWNTMFGVLPLQADGHTFYYADNNFQAQRIYSAHRWPCCAGTFTQVAADYGINTWQLGSAAEQSVWVNLYLPSTLSWQHAGASIKLTQESDYPASERVRLTVATSRPARFTLHLRLPAWCRNPSLRINNRPYALKAQNGFAGIERLWHTGDQIDLHLPATLRLEPFPSPGLTPHPELAALCWGPWVLLPLASSPAAKIDDLLQAERIAPTEWRVHRANGDLYLRPFFAVGEGTYATYVRLV